MLQGVDGGVEVAGSDCAGGGVGQQREQGRGAVDVVEAVADGAPFGSVVGGAGLLLGVADAVAQASDDLAEEVFDVGVDGDGADVARDGVELSFALVDEEVDGVELATQGEFGLGPVGAVGGMVLADGGILSSECPALSGPLRVVPLAGERAAWVLPG